MNGKLYAAILIVLLARSGTADAVVLLDTTTLSFSASGSPNTISGSWDAPLLTLLPGETLSYFTIELLALATNYPGLETVTFNSSVPGNGVSMSLCFRQSCAIEPSVGQVGVVTGNAPQLWNSWAFLNRLIFGNSPVTSSGSSTINYTGGGGNAVASGNLMVRLYGEPSMQVPEPAVTQLLSLGLILLTRIPWRRSSPRQISGQSKEA